MLSRGLLWLNTQAGRGSFAKGQSESTLHLNPFQHHLWESFKNQNKTGEYAVC